MSDRFHSGLITTDVVISGIRMIVFVCNKHMSQARGISMLSSFDGLDTESTTPDQGGEGEP